MSLFALLSLFSLVRNPHSLPVRSDAKGHGQPTRCGHALTRRPLPGLARACRPSNLAKDKRPKGG